MKIFAHRGYSAKYPENTLAAFQAAIDLQVDGIELDVHVSKDNQLVVIHDERVDRTTDGTGFVKDYTVEELKALDAGSWFSPLFAAQKIPTLAEVFELVKGTAIIVNVELKSDIFPYPTMVEQVNAFIKYYELEKQVIISSFNHEALQQFKEINSLVEIAPLFQDIIVNLTAYIKSLHTNSAHVSGYVLQRSPALQALKNGQLIRVYTINEVEHMYLAKQVGVEAIFTDEVERAIQFNKA